MTNNAVRNTGHLRPFVVTGLVILSAAFVFLLDSSVELGVAGAVPYVAVVWLA